MSHLTRHERDAVIVFVCSLGTAILSGFLWGAGLSLFGAFSLVTFIGWAAAGVYLFYRGVRRAGRWARGRYSEASA